MEAYSKVGIKWSDFLENGADVHIKEMQNKFKNSKKPLLFIVNNVYRILIDEPGEQPYEVITYDQTVRGTSNIGNTTEWAEGANETSIFYTPLTFKQTRWNPDKEELEEIIDFENIKSKANYLFPFNKSNVEMIRRLTKNNRKCNFYVWDKSIGFGRICNNFEEWSSKDFETLIARDNNKPKLTPEQQLQEQYQQQQQQGF